MKKNIWFLCLLLAVFLFSCRNDENSTSAGEGVLDIKVVAEGDLKDACSRASSVDIPEVNDFELNLTDVEDGSVLPLGKFGDFVPVTTSVGEFVLSASYGDSKSEGFDALSFYGSTDVSIKDAQRTDASVVCKLDKAMVSISYTESFKDYFSDYSASIVSSNNTISFSKAETRPAYFVPGDLNVKLKVSRSGGPTDVELNPKNFLAEAQTHYKLTFDVDASTATLKIIFNDDPANTNNVEINISDSSLSADAPDVVPVGFVSGQEISLVEENTYSESLQLTVNAYAGLSKCKMEVSSAYLQSLGWPASLELTELTPEEEALLNASGLIYKGFSGNKDKMAFIDFDKFVSYLACMSTSDEIHKLTFTVTDNLTKVSDPVELLVKTKYNQFAFTGQSYVPYSSNSVEFDLTLDGDHNGVVFEESVNNGAFTQIDASRISIARTDGSLQSKVTISYLNSFVDTSAEYQVKATYGNKNNTVTFKVEAPELTLTLANGEASVWATKAYFKVQASAKSRISRTISSETIELQYKNGDEWQRCPVQSYDESKQVFVVEKLGDAATESQGQTYIFRAVYKIDGIVVDYSISPELQITTEAKLQIPNSGFEDWYSEMVWEKRGPSIIGIQVGGLKIYSFYPYKNIDSDKWWNTNNSLTTQKLSDYSWYYGAYPAVIPTNATETHTALWHIKSHGSVNDFGVNSITNDVAGEGNTSMEIATIGYGGNNWSDFSHNTQYREAGKLFIGDYSIESGEEFGHVFRSRPEAFRFSYKFYPYNGESTKAYIVLYDESKNQIGYGELNISEASDVYINTDNIDITYYNIEKKASYITIVFMSSSSSSPLTKDIQGNKGANGGYEDSRHIGSVFVVDNVELVY